MNFSKINLKLESDNLILKPISNNDRIFIEGMFQDNEIKNYYIVPKEAQQNHQTLVDYWLQDIKNGAGTCWIIHPKSSSSSLATKPCGFIAFEFRSSVKNARISYAILPHYRRKGIATNSISIVLENLIQNGVQTVEADIDRDNVNSEKAVKKLGFESNRGSALIDPEMMKNGEIRIRTLWKKHLIKDTFSQSIGRIALNATSQQIASIISNLVTEMNEKGQNPVLLTKYFYLLGRIKFLERNYEEAKDAFGQCNMITMSNGLPDVHETFYWFGKINDVNGDSETAKMYYETALKNYVENPDYISRQELNKEINK